MEFAGIVWLTALTIGLLVHMSTTQAEFNRLRKMMRTKTGKPKKRKGKK